MNSRPAPTAVLSLLQSLSPAPPMPRFFWMAACLAWTTLLPAQPALFDSRPGDELLARYFARRSEQVATATLANVHNLQDWEAQRETYRAQLQEMLGLSPWPERTPLQAEVTRVLEHDEFVVEMLHFQSAPGLYVTGNLYRPKEQTAPLPAILYVCGHSVVKENGVSFGNKVGYHHHGAWFARNGYVCLTIDTIQLGEIEGLHHGTYREGMWWWASRGYTPAGVEAWNGIRAIDYLQSRPEVDPDRIGVTGRSGGGAYSWWVAALDERIKCAVPVAGITSMHNHIVDGCIEGHCDCMFMVNTYQWDFPLLAALVAPRPLLISNTDKDTIFPLDGVVDVHRQVRRIYDLHKVPTKLGLQITEGPHKDTQELRLHAFVWFNRFLKGSEDVIQLPAEKLFTPPDLKVFEKLPTDERVTTVQHWFVPRVEPLAFPASDAELQQTRTRVTEQLRQQSLCCWPEEPLAPQPNLQFSGQTTANRVELYHFASTDPYQLPLVLIRPQGGAAKPRAAQVFAVDDRDWRHWQAALAATVSDWKQTPEAVPAEEQPRVEALQQLLQKALPADVVVAVVLTRGIGPTEWSREPKKRAQLLRRFLLLGESLDALRAYDLLQGLSATRELCRNPELQIELTASRELDGAALVASLFTEHIQRLTLHDPRPGMEGGPTFLNALKFCDVPLLLLLAGTRVEQVIIADRALQHPEVWLTTREAGSRLGLPEQWLAIQAASR